MNPFEARQEFREAMERSGGRLSPYVAFEITGSGMEFDRYFNYVESGGGTDDHEALKSFLAPGLLQEITEAAGTNNVRVVDADSGRGASGYAIAVELLEFMATVGGATAFLAGAARTVRHAYTVVKRRLGQAPVISVGAAAYLAAADLIDRIDDADFTLMNAGDVRDELVDFAYTGEDHFYVIFQRKREMFFYLVEPRGEVSFVGSVTRGPTDWELAIAGEDE